MGGTPAQMHKHTEFTLLKRKGRKKKKRKREPILAETKIYHGTTLSKQYIYQNSRLHQQLLKTVKIHYKHV